MLNETFSGLPPSFLVCKVEAGQEGRLAGSAETVEFDGDPGNRKFEGAKFSYRLAPQCDSSPHRHSVLMSTWLP